MKQTITDSGPRLVYRVSDVARALGRSVAQVRNYLREGRIMPSFHTERGEPLCLEADFLAVREAIVTGRIRPGRTREARMPMPLECTACSGFGYKHVGAEKVTCKLCGGTGYQPPVMKKVDPRPPGKRGGRPRGSKNRPKVAAPEVGALTEGECAPCNGRGRVELIPGQPLYTCRFCNGSGWDPSAQGSSKNG